MTVEVGTLAAKGATAIPVTALTEKMYRGQALAFVDADGLETLAILSADAAVGATSLTVYALPEAIAAAATAQFPAKLSERSSVNFSASANTAETQTGDSGGEVRMIVSGFGARTITTDGVFVYKNAGYETARNCFLERLRVFARVVYPAPSPAYTKGLQRYGYFVVNSMGNDASADAQITAPVELTSDGGVCEVDPTPTA
jgi:predicted secreted protein